MLKPVVPFPNFSEIEDRLLRFWKKNQTFEKSISQRPASKSWTFLDGPPFITGLPHYGTLLSSIPKDLFPRFWAMKGYRVRRVWGWDCHGLPAENKVEARLGLKSKREIEEKVGVAKFIAACKSYVSEVSAEWEWYIDHVGRWVDFKNAYKTMDLDYMESVLWVFKKMYEKGYIYKGLRVSLYCPHCVTPISNFEVAMDADNYQDVQEKATVYKYPLTAEKGTYFLAWSTTPWNKLVTSALAVNPKLTYVKVSQGGEKYILAEETLAILKSEPKYHVLEKFSGEKLLGQAFVPHYDFYQIEPGKKAFVIVGGDFVTAEEGTGIVTLAAYGEDDLAVMQRENVQIVLHLNEEGILRENVPQWAGMSYLAVNKLVNADLNERHLIYDDKDYRHRVPTCWRCHTRLYYAPQDAWYVNVQKLKPAMRKTNEQINWVPKHFKHGRFLKSLEAAPDWCISRSRYWGSPVPVWECQCGERFVPGSLAELVEKSGQKITDLHKPGIDAIKITCSRCGQSASRVTEVLDSWIEAGSAAFAERHYPFDKKQQLNDFFPPDFITEYTGQIRAWFYVVHVIANAIFSQPGFKNVLVSGVILGNDGRKMSKNLGNYPDPKEMLQKYGGDALRLYLLRSPVMQGNDILISEDEYRNQVKEVLLPLWNSYKFFVIYAGEYRWQPKVVKKPQELLNQWITIRLEETRAEVTAALENYNPPKAVRLLADFVTDLSGWYIRRSRSAFAAGQKEYLQTLGYVLTFFAQMAAPVIPFLSEEIYQNLTGATSVHLTDWPAAALELSAENRQQILTKMTEVRRLVEFGHAARKKAAIKIRQPLASLTAVSPLLTAADIAFAELIKEELNIKTVVFSNSGENSLSTKITPELKIEGEVRDLIREIQVWRKKAGFRLDQKIDLEIPAPMQAFAAEIKAKTLAKKITWGKSLKVSASK